MSLSGRCPAQTKLVKSNSSNPGVTLPPAVKLIMPPPMPPPFSAGVGTYMWRSILRPGVARSEITLSVLTDLQRLRVAAVVSVSIAKLIVAATTAGRTFPRRARSLRTGMGNDNSASGIKRDRRSSRRKRVGACKCSVPALTTTDPRVLLPERTKVPAFAVRGPVIVLLPDNVWVPCAGFVKPEVSAPPARAFRQSRNSPSY